MWAGRDGAPLIDPASLAQRLWEAGRAAGRTGTGLCALPLAHLQCGDAHTHTPTTHGASGTS